MSSTQLQKRSFHVIERTRTSSKCQKMKYPRAKRAKILFSIVKYANLWGLLPSSSWLLKLPIAETKSYIFRWRSRFRHRRVCLSSLMASQCTMSSQNWVLTRQILWLLKIMSGPLLALSDEFYFLTIWLSRGTTFMFPKGKKQH